MSFQIANYVKNVQKFYPILMYLKKYIKNEIIGLSHVRVYSCIYKDNNNKRMG